MLVLTADAADDDGVGEGVAGSRKLDWPASSRCRKGQALLCGCGCRV